MALAPCKECGQKVAASASRCPSCGARQGMSAFAKVLLGLAAALGAMFVIGMLTKNDPERDRAKAEIEICFALSPQMHSTTHDERCQVLRRAYIAKHGSYP